MSTINVPTTLIADSVRYWDALDGRELTVQDFTIGDFVQFGDGPRKHVRHMTASERETVLAEINSLEVLPEAASFIGYAQKIMADWTDKEAAERLRVPIGDVPAYRGSYQLWTVSAMCELGNYLGIGIDGIWSKAQQAA